MRRRIAGSGAVALCFRNGRVDLARIARVADARPLVDVCVSVRQEGSEAETLSRLRKKYRLDRLPCVALIAENEYELQVMDAPSVPDDELKSAVRWRLKDVLDYPADAATIDVFSVPADPNAPTRGRSVYAVAARNEFIAARMAAFSDARLFLRAIDIPEMAQRNVAAMYETPGRAVVMLSVMEARSLLTFTANAELYLTRSIDVGLSQLRHAEGELRLQLFERVVLELQRSLDHFDRQFSYLPLNKLLVAPVSENIGLQSYLAENLYVPVEEVQLEQGLDMSRVPELASGTLQADQLMAIGAALRQEVAR